MVAAWVVIAVGFVSLIAGCGGGSSPDDPYAPVKADSTSALRLYKVRVPGGYVYCVAYYRAGVSCDWAVTRGS